MNHQAGFYCPTVLPILLFFAASVAASEYSLHQHSDGAVSVISASENPALTSPEFTLNAETSLGPMAELYGELRQIEEIGDIGESGGEPLIDGKAYLTWWGVEQSILLLSGSADGDTVSTRWRNPLGIIAAGSTMQWQQSGSCWQLVNSSWPCISSTIWTNAIAPTSVGDWQFSLLFNDVVVPSTVQDFRVIGLSLESVGQTQFEGRAGTTVKTPIQAKLIDYDGVSGAPGENVRFRIPSGLGTGFGLVSSYTSPSSGSGATSLTVPTNAVGIATVYVELGNADKSFTVTASSSAAPIDPPYHTSNPEFDVTSRVTEVEDIDEEKNQGEVGENECIGNPVNVITGNKFQREQDLVGNSAAPLEFTRYYNLTDSESTTLGIGWRHSYDRSLVFTKIGKGQNAVDYATLRRPDGRILTLVNDGSGWLSDPDVYFRLTKQGGKWELRTEKDTIELYDGKGRLRSITDSRGNTQELSYDNQQLLTEVISNSNEKLEFTYDAENHLLQVEYQAANPDPANPSSRLWRFAYTDGRLTTLTNPDLTQRSYHYENPYHPNALTGVTDERGIRYVTWEYDELGKVASSYHAEGADRVDVFYEPNGMRQVTNSLGNITTYKALAQLGQGKITDTTGPTCSTGGNSTAQYTYDPGTNNLLAQTVDGTTTNFGNYDANGNPGYKIEAVGTSLERRTDFNYDPRFHSKITTISEPSVFPGANKITSMEYDDFGNLTRRAITGYDPDGNPVNRTETFQYDGPYNQLSQIDGPRTDVPDITKLEYYPDDPGHFQNQGMLLRVTGPKGVVLRDYIHYNEQRLVISEIRPNGLTLNYQWEPKTGRLESLVESDGQSSRTTRWTYLPTGEVETVTLPDGSSMAFSYDDARRLIAITDGIGNRIDYELDSEGNRLSESVYDSGGTLHRTLTQSFDVYNRLDSRSQANEQTDYDFAADGTLARETNGRKVQTDYGYDDLKRLTQAVQDSTGADDSTAASQIAYGYDDQDNLTGVMDPADNQTTYSFDDLGHRTERLSPDTGTTSYKYDEAGNIIRKTDAKGQIFTFTYDALNRLVAMDAPGDQHDIEHQYDGCVNGVGRLCGVSRGTGMTGFAYNSFGDLAEKIEQVQTGSGQVAAALDFTYDAAGRIQTITYPGATQVTYAYDAVGNVSGATLNRDGRLTEVVSNVQYKPFGPLTTATLGNGISRTLAYDHAYRITAVNDPVYNADLSYDSNGNITYQSRNIGNLQAEYDALDKLVTATGPAGTKTFQYDRNANRKALTNNGIQTTYGYTPDSNRLTQINADPVVLDANGNTTQMRGMGFSYSPDNRLISVDGLASYSYNGLGERVLKTASNEEQVFLYGPGGRLMAKLDGTGQTERIYVYLSGQPAAVVDEPGNSNGNLYYIHNDHLGTPQGLTDENGILVWRATYSPFGLAQVEEDPDLDGNTIEFKMRFPGQYYDEETGLHYNYFRDYDPATGRYLQSDPIGISGGLNTYSYVFNNPLINSDPTGLDASLYPKAGGTADPSDYTGPPLPQIAVDDGSRLGVFGCLIGCASYLEGDPGTNLSIQATIGGGITLCDPAPVSNRSTCEESINQDCGMYDPNCDNEIMPPSISPPGKSGYLISISMNTDGTRCINIGPHQGLPIPGINLGGVDE